MQVIGWRYNTKYFLDLGQAPPPTEIRQKSVVAHSHQPFRQNMQEISTDEFIDLQCQCASHVVIGVVLHPETEVGLVYFHDPLITNGDPMGVTRQVIHYLARAG